MIAFTDYPYFFSSLIGLFIVILVYVFSPRKRQIMFVSGLTLSLLSPASIFHEGSYWNTKRLIGVGFGIEEIIFCFSVGSLIAFFLANYVDLKNFRFSLKVFLKKFSIILFLGCLLQLILFFFSIDIMSSTLITQITIFGLISYFNKYSMSLSLIIAGFYTIYYLLMLKFFYIIFPLWKNDWNGLYIWPFKIYKIPVEEIVWVLTFTLCWIAILLYSLDLRFYKKDKTKIESNI